MVSIWNPKGALATCLVSVHVCIHVLILAVARLALHMLEPPRLVLPVKEGAGRANTICKRTQHKHAVSRVSMRLVWSGLGPGLDSFRVRSFIKAPACTLMQNPIASDGQTTVFASALEPGTTVKTIGH